MQSIFDMLSYIHGAISPSDFCYLASTLVKLKEKQANNLPSHIATPLFLADGCTSVSNDKTSELIKDLEAILKTCSIDYKTANKKISFSGDSHCIVFRQTNQSTKEVTIGYYERSKILENCGITKLFRTSYKIYSALLNHHMDDIVNVYTTTAIRIEIIYLS